MGTGQSAVNKEELLWSADPELRHSTAQWKGMDVFVRRTENNFRVCDPLQGEKKLHFRLIFPPLPESEFPSPEELRAHIPNGVFICFHGMGSHSGYAIPLECWRQLAHKSKCVVIAPDILGDGYSEGLRGLYTDVETPVHQHLDLVTAVLSGSEDSDRLQCDDPRLNVLRARWEMDDCPFHCIGISYGGTFAIVATLALQGFGFKVGTTPPRSWPMLEARFRGSVLISPFVSAPLPSPIIAFFLRHAVGPLIPNTRIPRMYDPAQNMEASYRDPEYRKLMEHISWDEGCLPWCGPMRFRTGITSIDVISTFENDATLKRITSPLLVLCDPEDQVTLFSGYQRIATLAENVELVEMPGALHDIVVNESDAVVSNTVRWISTLPSCKKG
eukprot:GEMP01044450.1.p1 GENE.GEMP01044450.1~~GEMP01044450.1.p1  ORF type:complete len:387 (+),score=77.88 GEMP01044450.1:103-1263(+)